MNLSYNNTCFNIQRVCISDLRSMKPYNQFENLSRPNAWQGLNGAGPLDIFFFKFVSKVTTSQDYWDATWHIPDFCLSDPNIPEKYFKGMGISTIRRVYTTAETFPNKQR